MWPNKNTSDPQKRFRGGLRLLWNPLETWFQRVWNPLETLLKCFETLWKLFANALKPFWNALKLFGTWKHFRNPLEMFWILWKPDLSGKKYSPSLSSLSTCWQMHESTACYNFFLQKCYLAAWFGTDLFIVVERLKDIMHVKLLLSLVAKILDVWECKCE